MWEKMKKKPRDGGLMFSFVLVCESFSWDALFLLASDFHTDYYVKSIESWKKSLVAESCIRNLLNYNTAVPKMSINTNE